MDNAQVKKSGPDFKALGLKSAAEIIDILAMLKIEGERVIKDDSVLLNPQAKAKSVMEFFIKRFRLDPAKLPYLASLVKHDLKNGKISWRKT